MYVAATRAKHTNLETDAQSVKTSSYVPCEHAGPRCGGGLAGCRAQGEPMTTGLVICFVLRPFSASQNGMALMMRC